MPLKFEQEFAVCTHECDTWGRMSCGAALRRIQEISIAQCNALGITDEVYERHGCVFLLSRLSFEVGARMPAKGEQVRIETRAFGAKRAVYHRVTSLHTAGGEKLCEADSRWVLVDMAHKRILRRAPEGFPMPFLDEPDEEHEIKLPKAGELPLVGEGVATYTLCDTNGHLNNTRYADLVCDALPLERFAEGPLRKLLLYFHTEIPLGAGFALWGALNGAGYSYRATTQAGKNFDAYAVF